MNPIPFLLSLPARRKAKRHRKDLFNTIRHTLEADSDILSDKQKSALTELLNGVKAIPKRESYEKRAELSRIGGRFQQVLDRNSTFYSVRNFLDVVVVALAVAFGIRAIFLQPFKIPTSSMQPTLFGIHYIDRVEAKKFQSPVTCLFLPFGASEAVLHTKFGGEYQAFYQNYSRGPFGLLPLLFQPGQAYMDAARVTVGGESFRLPGGDLRANLYRYLDQSPEGSEIPPDTTVFDGYLSTGDHLFVDRFSMHFLPLRRGEVFVFNTENLRTRQGVPLPGYYYIKRLVGMPGDTLKIVGNVLYVKEAGKTEFVRADELAPKLKKVYSGKGGYQGHLPMGLLENEAELEVPPHCFFAMGDNTSNSLDSREWSFVPHRNIIGRALNIFWPVTRRWGFVDTQSPLDTPTTFSGSSSQPREMRLQ